MKIALIHDWLNGMRGGEKVLEAMCELYPQADILTLFHKPGTVSAMIEKHKIIQSFFRFIPNIEKYYKFLLPLFPVAAELLPTLKYDLIISSSHAVAKNVRKKPGAIHIAYIHSPMRYIWDMFDDYYDRYFSIVPKPLRSLLNWMIKMAISPWKWWDVKTSKRVDYFITNSEFVGQRVGRFYGRDYKVIHPPVEIEKYIPRAPIKKEDYFIIVSALVPYKRVDLVVEAFNQSEIPLIVVGKGSMYERLKSSAKSNIKLMGFLPDDEMIPLLQRARGFIYPQKEDFGISAVEAQAAGTPVIAYKRGGALESVVEGQTGIFFDEQTVESLNNAVEYFRSVIFDLYFLQTHVRRFSRSRFEMEFRSFIDQKLADRGAKISQ